MNIKVTSSVFGKTELTGEYNLFSPITIKDFAESVGLTWDYEALIVVNDTIIEADYLLQNGDHVYFLTPIVGG